MTSNFCRIACVAVAACCMAAPASAQQGRPDRPYRGLFGGGIDDREETLVANGSVGVGVGNNVLAVPLSSLNLEVPQIGGAPGLTHAQGYGYLSAGLSYNLTKRRAALGASVATSGQYVPDVTSPYIPSHSASVGASLQLSRRSRLTASHIAYLQPYNILAFGPPIGEIYLGQALPIESNLGVTRDNHVSQFSNVAYTRQVGRRSSFEGSFQRFARNGSGEGETSRTVGGRFTTGITRGLGVHLGYGYTQGSLLGDASRITGHNIDAGVDFNRTLGVSISRRTKLSFGTGSSVLTTRFRNEKHTYFVVTGSATLTHEIARSWATYVNYNRGISFVERFGEPFINDSGSVGVNGLITRRLDFKSSAGVVIGKAGLSSDATPFRSYYGFAGMTAALTRLLALGTDYSYYQYHFDASTRELPIGLAPQLGRHSARVYLTVWVPILQRGRRTDATR